MLSGKYKIMLSLLKQAQQTTFPSVCFNFRMYPFFGVDVLRESNYKELEAPLTSQLARKIKFRNIWQEKKS